MRLARLLPAALLVASAFSIAGEPDDPPESAVSFDETSQPGDLAKQAAAIAEKGDPQGAASCLDRLAGQVEGKVDWAGEGLWLPAWRVAHRRARKLPQAVLDLYAKGTLDKALADLAEARREADLGAEAAVVRTRFVALPDGEILLVARDLAEAGRASEAEAFLEELVVHSPPSPSHPMSSVLLARSRAARGEAAGDGLRAALSAEALATPVSIGGETSTVSEWLERIASSSRPPIPPSASEPGGGLLTPPPACKVPADKPAWSITVPVLPDLYKLPQDDEDWDDIRHFQPGARRGPSNIRLSSTIAGGNVIIDLGKSLFAFRLSDGAQAWTRGGERGLAAYLRSGAVGFHGVVSDGERVIALVAGRGDEGKRRGDVLCLKAAGGKLVWSLDDDNDGKGLSFVGVPLVHARKVYLGAVEEEDSGRFHVVCVSADEGKLLWNRFLGSRPAPNEDYGIVYRPEAVLCERGGAVYVSTAMGLFATLDPASGDLLWGLKYGGNAGAEDAARARYMDPGPVRAVSAPLSAPEGIWFAPSDLTRYLLIDPVARGIAVSRRKDVGEAYRFLVGHDGGLLALGGREVALYSRAKGLVAHTELGAAEGAGRPALAEGLLVVPRLRELVGLSVPDFGKAWSVALEQGQSGDVLIGPNGIALVSCQKVSWFPWK